MKKTFSNSLATTALLLVPGALLAQQMTGTSHPEQLNDSIVTAPATPAQPSHYVKPSPAVPIQSVPSSTSSDVSGAPVLIQRATPAAAPVDESYHPYHPNGGPVETAKAVRAPSSDFVVTDDPTSGVVMDVPSLPNEVPGGALLHASLNEEISTAVTEKGSPFNARLLQPLLRGKEILVPSGSLVTGRIAQVKAGNRLHGGPTIQLIPEYVVLPDGERHHIEAQVVDLPYVDDAEVNGEGVIRGRDHVKQNAVTAGALTGTSTIAGAMIGGGVGAAVGAGIGAGVATVWWLRHEQEQTLRANTEIVFSLGRPLLMTATKQ